MKEDVRKKIKLFLRQQNEDIKIFDNNFIFIEGNEVIKAEIRAINYVNIEGRKLAYHLTNGQIEYSKSIQSNFIEEVHPLEENPFMIFAAHSILVNMLNVKAVDKRDSTIKFENGEKIRIPKAKLNEVYDFWKEII